MWTLDPIDGTKGFLRGEQYAVCLALLVDSSVEVGVIGCPNLPLDPQKPDDQRGCLFIAVRGQGTEQVRSRLVIILTEFYLLIPLYEQRSLTNSQPTPIRIPSFRDENINFLESVESGHSSHGFNERVAQIMKIFRQPTRMDSQAKYFALARGDGGVYLRMPVGSGYREKIWVSSFLC